MAKSLNRATLIGNLTRDPELRYTPQGTAVCSFSIATNRSWKTDSGETKEDAEFHRIVAWDKLAEICAQLLTKGKKTFVEGRLQTRKWTTKDGEERTTTEIVINDMILLENKGAGAASAPASSGGGDIEIPDDFGTDLQDSPKTSSKPKAQVKAKKKESDVADESADEDIPF